MHLHSVFDEVHGLDDGCGATPAQPAEQKLPPVRHLNLLRHFPSFFLSKVNFFSLQMEIVRLFSSEVVCFAEAGTPWANSNSV